MHIKNNIELPSNKKFGIFLTFVFSFFALYLFYKDLYVYSLIVLCLSCAIVLLTTFSPERLILINKYWMKFGFIIGLVVSPFVLGIIFFGLITPVAILMRVFGRDELNLKLEERRTFWKFRDSNKMQYVNFKKQF